MASRRRHGTGTIDGRPGGWRLRLRVRGERRTLGTYGSREEVGGDV